MAQTAQNCPNLAPSRPRLTLAGWAPLAPLCLALVTLGCAAAKVERRQVVQQRVEPIDEVQRVGTVWQSVSEARGFRSEPNPVALFDTRTTSTLTLARTPTIEEKLTVEDYFEMRAGGKFRCISETRVQVAARYGWREQDAALEVQRPAVRLQRNCTPPGFGEAEFTLPETLSRFVLRGDELHAFMPATERRVYIPLE